MVDAFAARQLPLFVAYYRRGMQRFVHAKALIDRGEIGTITGVVYQSFSATHRRPDAGWRLNLADSGAGLFLDVGSHTLDVLDFLLGPLTHVAGVARHLVDERHPDVENAVAMSFLAGGAPGVATWNFCADASREQIHLLGSDGSLELSTFGHEPLRLTRHGAVTELPFPTPPHVHSGLVETIVTELTTGKPACPSTGVSAARTSKVMDEVLTSFYGERDTLFRSQLMSGDPFSVSN